MSKTNLMFATGTFAPELVILLDAVIPFSTVSETVATLGSFQRPIKHKNALSL